MHHLPHGIAGQVTLHPTPPPSPLPGGILGDEMGLGKTAEMHALMVAQPRPFTPSFISPQSSSYETLAGMASADSAMMVVDESADPVTDALAERRLSGKLASSSKPKERAADVDDLGTKTESSSNHRQLPTKLIPGQNLVVCPTQLKDQWINEVIKPRNAVFYSCVPSSCSCKHCPAAVCVHNGDSFMRSLYFIEISSRV